MYLLVLGNYEMQDIFKIFFKKKKFVFLAVSTVAKYIFSVALRIQCQLCQFDRHKIHWLYTGLYKKIIIKKNNNNKNQLVVYHADCYQKYPNLFYVFFFA